MSIQDLRNRLARLQGKKDLLVESLQTQEDRKRTLEKELEDATEARALIQQVALATQEQLRYHLSEIVTLAMETVFPDPYSLGVDFVERRNTTECDLTFERDGCSISPMLASGGGAVDVASFALRISLWSLQKQKSRPLFILDEPIKHLSPSLLPKAVDMIKEVSARLKLQILMIHHNPIMADGADRVIVIQQKGGVSSPRSSLEAAKGEK